MQIYLKRKKKGDAIQGETMGENCKKEKKYDKGGKSVLRRGTGLHQKRDD